MRLIDADALYDLVEEQIEKETGAYTRGRNTAFNIVKSALRNECATPAIDPESLRPHGRWVQKYHIEKMHYSPDDIEQYKVPNGFYCSCCNEISGRTTNYCPNCGAKMDAKEVPNAT